MALPTIPYEDVAALPLPGMSFPVRISFSPDGKYITFLDSPEGSLVRRLYAFDPQTGQRHLLLTAPGEGATEENLSLEEKLRRERQRQHDLGVTTYAWSPRGGNLLLPLPDGLYIWYGVQGEQPRKLMSTERGPVLDPRFSPDGEWVAFVQNSELWVIAAGGGVAVQLTRGAAERGCTNGLAEYIAQEEMGRGQGYWWSPDSSQLAFEEVDENHIPIYRIFHQGKEKLGEEAQEDHRYPFAGQANARVRMGVVDRQGGSPIWMDLGPETDIYLARVHWLPDGRLLVEVENREQTRLDLLTLDPRTGQSQVLFSETSDVWINLNDLFWAIKRGDYGGHFLWGSERSGFQHLYLYDSQGQLVRQLTSGDWMVDSLAGVDTTAGLVYFTGTRETPLEKHLYAVPLAGGEVRRITKEAGMHTVVLDKDCRHFIDTHDCLDQPPRVTLRSLQDDKELAVIHEPGDSRISRLGLRPPELVTLHNRDNDLLYGAIYRPPMETYGSGPYPTIVSVYGGPHVQMVANTWRMSVAMRAQALARQGFLVFVLDNRGSARRGLAFEGAVKHRLGKVEVQDQVDGVRWLVQMGLADADRVGIYGWSYGGYMAAMCLCRSSRTFKAAVAGAPVTHWDGYDTHYTERYMGTPQTNPEGYRDSAVMQHICGMAGRLMLVHGLIDENVHFRHTARMINALIEARKTYHLLLFPDERHSPRKQTDRVFMEEQIRDFLVREVMGSSPG
jgi:dipeptidyl-peptidase 4